MFGNDLVRQSALDKPRFNGEFLPSFFNAEALLALGLCVEDLKEHAEIFENVESYRKNLALLREEHENRAKDPLYTLQVRTAGAVFGERCNLRLRIPKEWPAHMLLKTLLNACKKVTTDEVKRAKRFSEQLELLQRIDGWSDTTYGGNVNTIFMDRLSNALELVYFGVDPEKACFHPFPPS
jgi:hypothetical protein